MFSPSPSALPPPQHFPPPQSFSPSPLASALAPSDFFASRASARLSLGVRIKRGKARHARTLTTRPAPPPPTKPRKLPGLPDDVHGVISTFLPSPSILSLVLALGKAEGRPDSPLRLLGERRAAHLRSGFVAVADSVKLAWARLSEAPACAHHYSQPLSTLLVRNKHGLPVRVQVADPRSPYN
ncbi:hypothetical protein TeGR_g12128, partial [Tetraparma gracilis]